MTVGDEQLNDAGSRQSNSPTAPPAAVPPSLLMRVWIGMPDWGFRLLGAAFFFGFFGWEIAGLVREGFWESNLHYERALGRVVYLPWAKVLILATYFLIASAFVFRLPPRSRADRPREIAIPLIAAFWPFLPWALAALLRMLNSPDSSDYQAFIFDTSMSFERFCAGAACVCVGNALDVWGYASLFRSVSIVAEARELVVSGPYRVVRHPVYLGQIVSPAGIWLLFAPLHLLWMGFYACFVAMQLYRGRVEDAVLERAFGERYRTWKEKTYWFV